MVTHILKDGSRVKDIAGHVVKEKDAPLAYVIIDRINKEQKNQKKD